GYRSALHLAQALAGQSAKNAPRLCLITRGAQAVVEGEAVPGVAHSTMWGLGRVIAMEQPNLRCLMSDLDMAERTDVATQIDDLVTLFRTADRETVLAWRGGKRYVARLVPRPDLANDQSNIEIVADAMYLITGGLGGIGLLLAEWLIGRGAKTLALMGRSAPT